MKRLIGLLLFVLILHIACVCLPTPSEKNGPSKETPIAVNDAIEAGFPVYLPSDDVLQSMGIAVSPAATINTQRDTCPYLFIKYCYEGTDAPALRIKVSDGCVATFSRGYRIELSWALEGTAMRVEENTVTPTIIFDEPVQQYQYVVFSEEPLSNTIKLLESMK